MISDEYSLMAFVLKACTRRWSSFYYLCTILISILGGEPGQELLVLFDKMGESEIAQGKS